MTAGQKSAATIKRLVDVRLVTKLALCCSKWNISLSDFRGEGGETGQLE